MGQQRMALDFGSCITG